MSEHRPGNGQRATGNGQRATGNGQRESAWIRAVPRLSEFYGIVIYMYFADHNPPHFHAMYGEHEALVTISDGAILRGDLPRTAIRLVEHWRQLHCEELADNWRRATEPSALNAIEPLQ